MIQIYNPKDGSISYNTTTTLPCQSRCNWLYSISDEQYNNSEYYGKNVIFEFIPDLSKNGDKVIMKLIDKDDYFDCFVFSTINSDNSIITIYNILGDSLEKSNIKINKGYNNYKINTLNYNSGIYFVQLIIDGAKRVSNKFIIFR